MALQIIILSTQSNPTDGSFSVSGVFWLTAPTNNIVPLPGFQSQVPFIDITNLALLQAGTIVEQQFNSGLFASGTIAGDVQVALQDLLTTAQTNLTNSNSPISGLIGSVYNGSTWSGSNPFAKITRPQTILPNLLPDGFQLCFPGAGDDPVHGIAKGTLFQHQSDDDGYGPTTHSVNWTFNDWLSLTGGHIIYENAQFGDTLNYYLYAPATTVTTVGGTGNVNIVSGVVIIPGAATNHQVDLTTAVPVPSLTNTGYWNWTPAANGLGSGTITPNANGTGGYNLYTIQITLGEFVQSYPILGTNYIDLTVPAILPKKLLPQWVHQVQVNNSGHNGLKVVWALTCSRTITVGM